MLQPMLGHPLVHDQCSKLVEVKCTNGFMVFKMG